MFRTTRIMKAIKQFRLLMWKNFLLQYRRPISTAFELLIPVFLMVVLLLLRIYEIDATFHDKYIWDPFAIDKVVLPGHPTKWKVAFAPNNSETFKVMEGITQFVDVDVTESGMFADEKALLDFVVTDQEKNLTEQEYLGAVVFKSQPSSSEVRYEIRLPSTPRYSGNSKLSNFFPQKWYTPFVFPFSFTGLGPRSNDSQYGGPPSYYYEGFLALQRAIDFSIIQYKNKSFQNIDLTVRRFPYPDHIVDQFIVVIQNSFPLLLMLSLVYTALSIVKSVVYEKEKKLKESMKIMGLGGSLHWIAWFMKCFIMLLLPMAIVSILLCVRFKSGSGKMLQMSDGSLIFVFLMLYSTSAIMFCFMVSTFFYRANIAAAAGGIMWFLSYVPYFFIGNYYNQFNLAQKVASCLDFQVAMSLGANLIGRFEGTGSGVQWSNINEGVTVDDNFAFSYVLLMFIADSVIYGLITWYMETVYPGEFGIPWPWYFPFMKTYWCGAREVIEDIEGSPLKDHDSLETNLQPVLIEDDPPGLVAGVKIRNLMKTFKSDDGTGEKIAVNRISLNMYEGLITALLGHNGAGKTTTISILTGLFPPTSGTAIINGCDILNNLSGVRESLGICPQHNILFDTLTVKEHLQFFAALKGLSRSTEIDSEVERMIQAVGLNDKRDVMTTALSGGMKRRLSVGIALIGGSKVVLLDEPTTGMDVAARRFTWDLLQKERRGRTILLTTHFMDEADVLGDRIAIMANGEVKCCGSSLYLKQKYGVGYHMVMVKTSYCDVNQVKQLVQKYVNLATLESNVGLELSFVLPSESVQNFEGLFSEIEMRKVELGISSFGASVTTLEEVFIKVGQEAEDQEATHRKIFRQLSTKSNDAAPTIDGASERSGTPLRDFSSPVVPSVLFRRNSGMKLHAQRWRAMFVKRFLHSKRHKASIISQLVMPAVFTLLALIVAKTFPKGTDSPPRDATVKMFQKNYVAHCYGSNSSFLRQLDDKYAAQFTATETIPVRVPGEYACDMVKYLLDKEKNGLSQFNVRNLVALQADSTTADKVSVTAWFNNEAFHSSAASLNALSNGLLRVFSSDSGGKITTINYPLPKTTQQSISDLSFNPLGFNIAFSVCFGVAFLASSFIVFLVQERSTKAKHVQFVSGVDPVSYWTSAYLWDLINFLLPSLIIIILFACFQLDAFTGKRVGYIFLLLMLYGWAVIPFMYIFSFVFDVASTAYIRMTILNVVTGLVSLMVVNILSIPSLNLINVANILKWVFLVLPNYDLGQGIVDLYNNYQYTSIFYQAIDMCVDVTVSRGVPRAVAYPFCKSVVQSSFAQQSPPIEFQENYLAWAGPGIGRYVVFLLCQGCVFFALVLAVEYRLFDCQSVFWRLKSCLQGRGRTSTMPFFNRDSANLDSDVLEEIRRVENDSRSNDVLAMKRLTKVFGRGSQALVAVDHLSLGVPHGECFGLLGQNGAGKTTTFRMLTGDETISMGTALIDSYDVRTETAQVRQRIGYCPQFDALIDLMTGRELLTMYSRLRGVPESRIPELVDVLARKLAVDEHIDKVTRAYSGGNKRKLSTAIALAGDPPLIFLDEPSSGMDPVARRMLWGALSEYVADGKSIVITSHSMEECEALCTRLAIMVNGQFKCLGSPQHLKNKFGEGYTLIARVGGSQPDTTALKGFLERTFPGSTIKDEHVGYVHYQLIDADRSWAKLFGTMERAKLELNIQDYSISQTTLEQVFLNFTKFQRPVEDTD